MAEDVVEDDDDNDDEEDDDDDKDEDEAEGKRQLTWLTICPFRIYKVSLKDAMKSYLVCSQFVYLCEQIFSLLFHL